MKNKKTKKDNYSSFRSEHYCVNHISWKVIQLLSSGLTKSPKCQSHSGLIKKKSGGRQEVDRPEWLCKNMSWFIQHIVSFFPPNGKITSGPGIICSCLSNVVATMIGHISTIEPGVKKQQLPPCLRVKTLRSKTKPDWKLLNSLLLHVVPQIKYTKTTYGTKQSAQKALSFFRVTHAGILLNCKDASRFLLEWKTAFFRFTLCYL